MIRKAGPQDLDAVAAIYSRIHDREEAGETTIGWIRDVYPTENMAKAAIEAGELFVLEEHGKILASAKINREQVPEYADAQWEHPASDDKIMVLHTLTVDPLAAGHGIGTQFVRFYEAYAMEQDCSYLRMDTNVINTAARALYGHLGYKEVGVVDCEFNGIPDVRLVCLEKYLGENLTSTR